MKSKGECKLNTDKFTGKAQAYATARPGYPDKCIEYIRELVSPDAVFADIGAGTGKFTELLARYGYKIFAVEPNADMREQLKSTLSPFPNAKIVYGSAENTTLPDHSVDVIVCAQALNYFDIITYKRECQRIGKTGSITIALYNNIPGIGNPDNYNRSTALFFKNPTVRAFSNPVFYTREKWHKFMLSHAGVPVPSDPDYEGYIKEMDAIFDRENINGLLRLDAVTKVYSEILRNES
jgi:ubiquinone/menaquinone biosynthesis C-methylase UbiE